MAVRAVTTTYGRGALDALAAAVAEIKRDDPMAAVTVIAPNNLAGIVARRHLAGGVAGGRGIAGIEVTTLARLAERLAATALAPRRPATRPVMAAAWRRALADDPGRFRDIADHPATVRALTQAHAELRDVSAGGRAAVGAATTLGAELVALHESVTDRVREAWFDATDVLTTAAGLVTADLGSCVLYLPQRLSQAEARFADALAERADVTVIVAMTGVRRADQAVQQSVARLGVDLDEQRAVPTATRILNASDSDDEVRCVVRDVVETLQSTPAHRVAVLYSAPAPYARLLHEHLAAAGIAVNGAGVRPADERAVARGLLEVLALAERDVPRAGLFQALAGAPVRDFSGRRIPLAQWERTSRAAGVVAGEDWANRLDAYAGDRLASADRERERDEPRDWLIDRLGRDAAVATDLRDFACRLRDELHRAQQMTTWQQLAAWCLDLFTVLLGADEVAGNLPAEEQYAAATVLTALSGLSGLDSLETSASFETLRDVIGLELSGSVARVGRFGEGVLVSPVSTSIGLDLDVVYVCGLSEDLYPGRSRADALLPDRARLACDGELPAARDRIDAKHRALLAAFAAAGVESVASFPRGDLRRSSRRLPSRFLLPSLRELSGDHDLAATEWDEPRTYGTRLATAGSFAGELLATTRLATAQEWRTRQAAAAGMLGDDTVAAGVAMIRARASDDFTRYDGNLAGVPGLPNYAVDAEAVSPTQLEAYALCPHAFFVQRLLGVEPVEQPEDVVTISAMDIGNLIHRSVEALVNEYADTLPADGEPWSRAQRDTMKQIVDDIGREYEQRGITGHPRLWSRERVRIRADALRLLDDDDRWRARQRCVGAGQRDAVRHARNRCRSRSPCRAGGC